jgi:hypothetical protein
VRRRGRSGQLRRGVAHDQPDPELGARDLVQVPADPGLGRRQVDHLEFQRAGARGSGRSTARCTTPATEVRLASFCSAGVTPGGSCFPGLLSAAPAALRAVTAATRHLGRDPRQRSPANTASTIAATSMSVP